ncbi:TrbC/VirB2 family protein [Candidatus Wolbachia massiliensis]|uniref:TrbC/VirB2 family protein n=1 Tax=Candidatus Wolbachia massiliensis TaxID=1845000 RepID=A0A7L7YPS4_9RICK|nr:TrbC/VirB2 family protein [Candidatus Wolbachia massiliensis]QOD38065.1 TrbC/VirB2 family protein [Candidatus Wolbachia massiliensis]
MKRFLLLVALILSFAFDANAADFVDKNDTTSTVICNIIGYTHGIGGPMITIVIIGAALLAIFGRMPWPALFALGAFTAVFFGAPIVVSKIMPNSGVICKNGAVETK